MKHRLDVLLAALIAAGVAGSALPGAAQSAFPGLQAAPPPPSEPQQTLPAAPTAPLPPIDDRVAFNHAERWIIRDYFERVREQQLRASRRKVYERALPAGLQQPPAKGDMLSATAIADMRPLPGPLLRQLPPARPDTIRRIAGKNALMLRASTGEVLDVLENVVF